MSQSAVSVWFRKTRIVSNNLCTLTFDVTIFVAFWPQYWRIYRQAGMLNTPRPIINRAKMCLAINY